MRNNWDDVYQGQEIILDALKGIEVLIFGGGTAIHRAVLSNERRESEDIDFFIDHYCGIGESSLHAGTIKNALMNSEKISILNYLITEEEKSHRFFCVCNGSDEVIKVELLDFTAGRFGDTHFISADLFPKVENAYNLILYKMKELCDRQDTIKDLYDLYFLFREHTEPIQIKDLLMDLQLKFKGITGYDYGVIEIVKALDAKNRAWDIIEKNVFNTRSEDIAKAIYDFRDELREAFLDESVEFALSHRHYIQNKTAVYGFEITPLEYLDVVEPNPFIAALAAEFIQHKTK